MDMHNVFKTALSLIGAVFIAAGVPALIFSIMLGIYGDICRYITYSIVALAVIPVFRRSTFHNPLLVIFITLLIPVFYLINTQGLKLMASIMLGYLAAVSARKE